MVDFVSFAYGEALEDAAEVKIVLAEVVIVAVSWIRVARVGGVVVGAVLACLAEEVARGFTKIGVYDGSEGGLGWGKGSWFMGS